MIASQAASVFTLTNVAVVPEVFGRSRWLKALLLTTVLGTLASLTIKGTVIATWKQTNPATWNLPFQVAGAIMVVAGLVVLVLVRESPAASFGGDGRPQRTGPAGEGRAPRTSWPPNAKVLVAGSLLFWAGLGSTGYVAILFFQRVLHAGASAQTIAGLVTGVPVFLLGILLGIPLSRMLSRRQLAIGAPLLGALLAGVQYFDTHIWQAVVLAYIGAPFIGAYVIVLAPYSCSCSPGPAVWASGWACCSPPSTWWRGPRLRGRRCGRCHGQLPPDLGLPRGHRHRPRPVNTRLRYPCPRTRDRHGESLWEWSVLQVNRWPRPGSWPDCSPRHSSAR